MLQKVSLGSLFHSDLFGFDSRPLHRTLVSVDTTPAGLGTLFLDNWPASIVEQNENLALKISGKERGIQHLRAHSLVVNKMSLLQVARPVVQDDVMNRENGNPLPGFAFHKAGQGQAVTLDGEQLHSACDWPIDVAGTMRPGLNPALRLFAFIDSGR